MAPLVLTDEAIERISDLDHTALELVHDLPDEQQAAVRARVIDERDYPDIAKDLRCSEAVVRKRVSRGLGALRARMEEKVTRIPELEQELVAAAARLQSPRRVPRRAALAAAAVAVVVMLVLAVVGATEKDRADRGRQPTGTPPSQRGAKVGIDAQTGVRLSLEGRQLTVSLLVSGPRTRPADRVVGARIRATCGVALAQVAPEGDPRNAREQRTRLWPAGRDMLRFRFARDISKTARWCRVEDPAVGHVAFVKFGSEPVGPLSATQTIG